MGTDYILASLPALSFGEKPSVSNERFIAMCGGKAPALPPRWADLETQLRNAVSQCRGGARYERPATGCDLYWRDRIRACFAESDIFKRDEMIDKVWWDAAGELTDPVSPLGKGALATYRIRLSIAHKRAAISAAEGSAAFAALTDGAAEAALGGTKEDSSGE